MKTEVIIQFEIEGFHFWREAPVKVEFLSYEHRHSFVVKCGYEVSDLNREKEIFIQRDYIKHYLHECYGAPCYFNNMSCEMIATDILEFSKEDGMIWCEVWEENTGGARVEL